MMKLPILYDLENNRIVLEKLQKSTKNDDDFIGVLGYCQFEENSKFVCVYSSDADDSVLRRKDFHTFKDELAPVAEGFDLAGFIEYEQNMLTQLNEMLDKCPFKDSYVADSLKRQISEIEDSLVPDYATAERIICEALLNANCLYDPILKDVIRLAPGTLTMSDFNDLKSGDLLVNTNSYNNNIQYIVFDKFDGARICFQYQRRIDDSGMHYVDCFNSRVYVNDCDIAYRRCLDAEKVANDIDIRDNVPAMLTNDGLIEIGYRKDIDSFISECSISEMKDEQVFRTELGGRPALIEFNANWRSSKRYNVILYTDDFTLVYPDDCSIVLQPKDVMRTANEYECAAFNAIVKEFTAQKENGTREDGYEKFGKVDELIVPVMGSSGSCCRSLVNDYPKEYADDMQRFKKFREALRSGDVLKVTLTNSRGGAQVFIRYTGEHPDDEPENWFRFDAMKTNNVITTFFTYKEKPVAAVSMAYNYSKCDDLKDFRTKVAEIEKELFEATDAEEQKLYEQHQQIAAEPLYPKQKEAFLSVGSNAWKN